MSESSQHMRTITLGQLLEPFALAPGAAALRITDLTQDSREVRAGSAFVALRGLTRHGLEFAPQACAQGASAVLWEPADGVEAPRLPPAVACVPVPGLSGALGVIADRFFGAPSSYLRICAFTGTNGKTTCAYLLAQCMQRLGIASGYIGTLGVGSIGALQPLAHTTPDVISMHRLLARMLADGVRDVAIEVSSHALNQQRIAGVRLHTAAFTNLTHDHLDYHRTMGSYGEAKARLFAFPGLRQMVVNVGDDFGRQLAGRFRQDARLMAAWIGAGADLQAWSGVRHLRARRVTCEARGLAMEFDGNGAPVSVRSHLIGRFNAENLAVVLACLLSLGVPAAQAAAALGACEAPPGRMEIVPADAAGKPLAVVDYAHTPDALAKALAALREHCAGELWCVFGCGGDRDPAKRPMMGAVADELADRIIVTDDNPRSEDPQAITRAIAAAITRHVPQVIGDRSQAIATALQTAGAADVVLIAGKGHEDYQIYGATRRSFSDRNEALRHLREAA
ncbi:MAG: UDP-N-acetylmuramoyl-L-alanyl-D-glutamate--2,6-diaminopimelate ligase [Steroidobacterales bacterium]